MTPLHHFIKNLLLAWIRVRLVLFTDRCTAIARVVANAEEIGASVVSAIGFGLVSTCSVGSGEVTVSKCLGVGCGRTL